MQSETNKAQQLFEQRYITSSEIMAQLKVCRTTIHQARVSGKLPNAIYVRDQIFIWERDAISPYLKAWKTVLDVRRGVAA